LDDFIMRAHGVESEVCGQASVPKLMLERLAAGAKARGEGNASNVGTSEFLAIPGSFGSDAQEV